EEVGRLPDELGAGVAVGADDGLVDVEEAALEVLDVDELGEVVEEAAVAGLAGAEGLGRLPLLRDVADDGDDLAAVEGEQPRLEVALLLVEGEGVLELAEVAGAGDLGEGLGELVADGRGEHLLHGPAEERLGGDVEPERAAGAVVEDG